VTAEPKMEELLASIRKAIHDDIGDQAVAGSLGGPIKGSMRELRVKIGEGTPAAVSEIEELRNKIGRTRAAEEQQRRLPSAGGAVAPPVRQAPVMTEPLREAPALRPSFAESDMGLRRSQMAAPRAETFRGERQNDAPPGWERAVPVLPAAPDYSAAGAIDAGMMSSETSAAAGAAFNRLAQSIMNRAMGDRPIEDLTRDLLRQMLKQWLDENLPVMVERLVREEIERVARCGR